MKILAVDIETSPIKGYVWSLWNQNLYQDQIVDPGQILCWAAKFVGDKGMTYRRYDDPLFLADIHRMLDEADAVLTYNGRKFDIPWLNTEFIQAGLTPPSPFRHIDLLETVKKQFRLASNKMQYVLQEFNVGTKLDHEGFPLWVKCMEGDATAWKTMEKYNKEDVKQLIKLYDLLLPWIPNHPNRSIYAQDTVCPNCGSKHLQSRGTYKTQVGIYRRMQCQDCGAWSRTRYTELGKEVRKGIIVAAN